MMKTPRHVRLKTFARLAIAAGLCVSLSGCLGAIVGTVVDVGVEVVKVPFKVGKGIADAVSSDDKKEKE